MLEPFFIQTSSLVKTCAVPAGLLNILRGIDLELERGQFVALVGTSGGGKSMFLNMLTGVDKPMALLERFDVVDQAEKTPDLLSGGQQQRVARSRGRWRTIHR